jgi:glutamate/tyrosine decarboxylase-like PLP-dependent enzyme
MGNLLDRLRVWLKPHNAWKYKANFEQLRGIYSEKSLEALGNWANVNLSDARDKPAQELAKYFVDYHRDLLQLPSRVSGSIVYSASAANERALELMRAKTGKTKVLMSNLTHAPSLIQKAHAFGLEVVSLHAQPELEYQVSEEEFVKTVERHGAKNIAGIVATYGTTQLGSIEKIPYYDSVQEMRNQGVWLHIDAAFGGLLSAYSPNYISKRIPSADSITIDPYKLIGMQGCALLFGEEKILGKTDVNYYNHSPYTHVTTLSAGPVALWEQSVRDIGEVRIGAIVDECIQNSRNIGRNLKQQGVQLIRNPLMHIVPIRLESKEQREELRDSLYKEGYLVGRVDIHGDRYERYGIRIVCSPREHVFRWGNLHEVEKLVIDFMKKNKSAASM